MVEITPAQPSPGGGGGERSQAGLERLKKQLAAKLEKSCGWIRDVNRAYQDSRKNPEEWLDSKTFSRYKLYGFLLFGDVWGKEPDGDDLNWAIDHLVRYLKLENDKRRQEDIKRFVNEFDALKLESLSTVMEVCEDIANTEVPLLPDVGGFIYFMAIIGYDAFKKASKMRFPDFVASGTWRELIDTMYRRAEIEESERFKQAILEETREFEDKIRYILTSVPRITDTLDSEITRLLTTKLKVQPSDVDYMLRCLEDCL